MTRLTILEFPDPRLRTKAEPVIDINSTTQRIIDNMFETMYAAPGIGLAATQVNIHQQMIVIDISEEKDQPLVFINPKITIQNQQLESYDEGCLSVPGFHETVKRPKGVRVEALDRNGNPFTLEPEGLLAVCIQHEVDHLNGKLFVDYLSNIKRQRIRKKLEKQHQRT
ncbi:peptide deformylase [Candidatus Endobugula sertula]|uniref:Peptide deformylase n=1 Tax=Candidatus Endobugula sertula TaxID=62101 RepID=A0A1D2QNN3_9GAMM|nr:peptide deformylase [Candidatus Endobugula sertula]